MKSDQNLLERLRRAAGSGEVVTEELMSRHTTFRIGGPADYFVTPHTKEEIRQVIRLCKEEEIPFAVLGNGSNLLVGDKGFRGVIIQLFKNFSDIIIEEETIYAQSGALLVRLANQAAEQGLTGLEFASGIPGTLGGAVVMNAGAYGGEMKDVILWSDVLTEDGEFLRLSGEELELGYRTSVIQKKHYFVLGAALRLKKGDQNEIRSVMKELKEKRVSKQPVEYPSAGSTFKRPEGYFAGKLIMDTGLRGFSVGGAQVSEKHCGFVINKGGATAEEVQLLMKEVADRVEEKFGVRLEPEVKMLGEFK
ncbi:UDP-N-acetylmuramate dehydrogenase [Blautia sp. OF03-15BH]|uniref:UDP-N-acetylmuramate dehydrogenase n=1 Tax=Blautia sp. OF03-15BH TaxID=2292287 RepID=UPI000E4EA108|nr:UDP-N-acetylmuramate dehydrogenase [Blautia sp. OF03-15BH]RGY03172.1 UDP-N-acetylmuramate dehydrogenase [Blautia sp. OF03-15BH]